MTVRKLHIISIISVLIALLDQASKYLVRTQVGNPLNLIDGILEIRITQNTGAGFSIFQGNNAVLIIITIIILVAFAYYYKKIPDERRYTIPVALILGGGIGNLTDRLFFGHVIDFIDFKIWPVFNIADSAITVGAVVLIYHMVKKK